MINGDSLKYDSRKNSFEFVCTEAVPPPFPAPPTTAEKANTYVHGKPTNPRRQGVAFKVVPATRETKKKKPKKQPRKLGKSKVAV